MAIQKPKDYLNNANLLEEILKSQAIQAKLPEEERQDRTAECLTPPLVRMLMQLVKNFASSWRWRGYTWNDDMQSEALLALCKVALKFNYEKATANGNPANPFGYYTQITKRVFLTLIEREKKQGKIRDEIIEMSDTDLLPSFGRQNEEDPMSPQKELDGTKSVESDPRKRRRKKKNKILKEDDTSKMTEAEAAHWLQRKQEEFLAKKNAEVVILSDDARQKLDAEEAVVAAREALAEAIAENEDIAVLEKTLENATKALTKIS